MAEAGEGHDVGDLPDVDSGKVTGSGRITGYTHFFYFYKNTLYKNVKA